MKQTRARFSPPCSRWRRWRSRPVWRPATASCTGAQANLNKHKAVPKFVAPGPGLQRDGRERAASTIFIIPASSQVPFVSTIANHIKRIATPIGVKVDDLAEPGPAVAVGAGHERGDRPERERDRPAGRQRPGRPAAADQGREGEGHPDDRRAPLRPEPALRAQRRRPRQHPVQDRRPADRRPGDRGHKRQRERARRHDQPGEVDACRWWPGSARSSASTARAAS